MRRQGRQTLAACPFELDVYRVQSQVGVGEVLARPLEATKEMDSQRPTRLHIPSQVG